MGKCSKWNFWQLLYDVNITIHSNRYYVLLSRIKLSLHMREKFQPPWKHVTKQKALKTCLVITTLFYARSQTPIESGWFLCITIPPLHSTKKTNEYIHKMFFKDTYFMKRATCLCDLKSIENLCIIPKRWFFFGGTQFTSEDENWNVILNAELSVSQEEIQQLSKSVSTHCWKLVQNMEHTFHV